MNLDDRTILELNELCHAVIDEIITDRQQKRLAELLEGSEEARQHYVRTIGLSASLHTYASEMQTAARDATVVRPLFRPGVWWWTAGALAAAAAVTVLLTVFTRPTAAAAEIAALKARPVEYVARLTAAKGIAWANGSPAAQPGDLLRKGQRLELAAGFAELTFDSGARLVLEGPVSLDVNSAWDAALRHGVVKAHVPPEAIGFRVTNPAVEIVDLGTEFTLIADGNGSAEVLVLKGEIEATPHSAGDQEPILLKEKESLHFAHSGVSDISDSAKKFARFTAPVDLNRFATAINYVHWSFDEGKGALLKADTFGLPRDDYAAHIEATSPERLAAARVEGQRQRGLQFDGEMFARASFPGLSGETTHTVAFWVKVPEEAPLSAAYSMVAWRADTEKLGFRPVHIGWNRNPTEGALGALRTDFGGGCAIGTTSLRDGHWHHVTVVFTPVTGKDSLPQVKLYLDGRLESNTVIPGKVRAAAMVASDSDGSAISDVLWLGCRLGAGGQKKDRFRGEIDELFIADRGLEPQEIVQVMTDNRVPQTAVADTSPVTQPAGTN